MVWVPFAFCISRRLAGWRQTGFAVARLVGSCEDFAWPHCFISSLDLTPLLLFSFFFSEGGQLFWILRQFQGSGYRVGRRVSKAWRHRRLRLWVGLRLLRRLVGVRCSRTRVRSPFSSFPPFSLQYFFNAACPYHGVVVRVTHIWTIC